MSTVHNNLNQAIDSIIEIKIKTYEATFDQKIEELERQLQTASKVSFKEILQQKEVFELLGIGRRRFKIGWIVG